MKTLKGVIAATTGKGVVVPDESDLHMVPWYFILSSQIFPFEFEESLHTTHLEFMTLDLKSGSVESNVTATYSFPDFVKIPEVIYSQTELPPMKMEGSHSFPEWVRIQTVIYTSYNYPLMELHSNHSYVEWTKQSVVDYRQHILEPSSCKTNHTYIDWIKESI